MSSVRWIVVIVLGAGVSFLDRDHGGLLSLKHISRAGIPMSSVPRFHQGLMMVARIDRIPSPAGG